MGKWHMVYLYKRLFIKKLVKYRFILEFIEFTLRKDTMKTEIYKNAKNK